MEGSEQAELEYMAQAMGADSVDGLPSRVAALVAAYHDQVAKGMAPDDAATLTRDFAQALMTRVWWPNDRAPFGGAHVTL